MRGFLASFGSKKVFLLLSLGFSSGLPLALSGSTLSAWLTNAGFNVKAIGLVTLVGLPYSMKFLWAPFLDRYRLPFLGRRRGWILVFQLLLVAALVAMALTSTTIDLGTIALFACAVAFLSASQDVVIDAYRTDVLDDKERGAGTATSVVGYRIAMLLSMGGALMLSDHMSWPTVYLVMAGSLSIGILGTFLAPEVEAKRPPRSLSDAVWIPFADFFRRPGALTTLAFVTLFKLGDYLASTMTTTFLITVQFSNTEIGALNKWLGLVATIVGVVVGGGLADRFGVRRSLLMFGALQALTNVGYLVIAVIGKSYVALVLAIAIDQFCGGLATAAFTAFLMSLCSREFSATQFALLSSAATIIGRLLGAFSGYLIEAVGWAGFFALTMAIAIPALLLLRSIPDRPPAPAPAPG